MRLCASILPTSAPQRDSGDVSNLVAPIPFLVVQLFSGEGHQGWAKDGQDQVFQGKEGRNR